MAELLIPTIFETWPIFIFFLTLNTGLSGLPWLELLGVVFVLFLLSFHWWLARLDFPFWVFPSSVFLWQFCQYCWQSCFLVSTFQEKRWLMSLIRGSEAAAWREP